MAPKTILDESEADRAKDFRQSPRRPKLRRLTKPGLSSGRKRRVPINTFVTKRPQTLAFALADSPVGLASWILEKFYFWSDHGDDLLSTFPPRHAH